MDIIINVAVFLISAVIFTFVGMYIRKKLAESKMKSAEAEAKKILDIANVEAENKRKEEIIKAKEEIMNARNELDQEIRERRGEVQSQETVSYTHLMQKELNNIADGAQHKINNKASEVKKAVNNKTKNKK